MYIERMKELYKTMKTKNTDSSAYTPSDGKSTLEEYMIILCNMCKVEAT